MCPVRAFQWHVESSVFERSNGQNDNAQCRRAFLRDSVRDSPLSLFNSADDELSLVEWRCNCLSGHDGASVQSIARQWSSGEWSLR